MSFSAAVGPFLGTKAGRGQWELVTATFTVTDTAAAGQAVTSGSPGITWQSDNFDGTAANSDVILTLTGDVEDIKLVAAPPTVSTDFLYQLGYVSTDVSAKTITFRMLEVEIATAGDTEDEVRWVPNSGTAEFTVTLLVKRTDGRIG